MELGQTLTPTLEQTLNTILSSLANFFGTTTDIIMSNAPEWLAKYGWYTVVKDLPFTLFLGVIISGIIAGLCLAIIDSACNFSGSKTLIITIIIFFVIMAIITIIAILPCVVAPELVGLEAAIALISK